MTAKDKFLSVPEVASRLNVHRNTVLYWIRQGYIKAVTKNSLVRRPQFQISEAQVKEFQKVQHVPAKRSA